MEAIKRAKVTGCFFIASAYPVASTSSGIPQKEREGTLVVTPHHLLFTANETGEETWIAHSLLQSVTLFPPSVTSLAPITLRTFTFETYSILFRDTHVAQEVFDSIKALVSSATLSSAYAFCAKETKSDAQSSGAGWAVYDPRKELARMGVGGEHPRTGAWRWSDVNRDYEFCSTYPSQLAVPAKLSDVTLRYGKTYRSKHRIPALVYLHGSNLGSITRSSQPMVGIKNARSIQDEKLIEAIFHSHAQHSTSAVKPQHAVYGARATNLIIDARPTTNAVANVAKGAGTENMEYYKDCKKAYLGVDNIHVMRDSLKAVREVLREAEVTGYVDKSALRKSGWLKHITALLDGSVLIARNVHLANSHVLVHCSDGWDRTSQLSSLAQICLDPFYRTIEGLAVLIEKDWVSFGHKFADRAGHFVKDRAQCVVSAGDNQTAQQALLAGVQKAFHGGSHAFKETSPVFPQFLDCIYQMLRQFPARFEYDERMLLELHRTLYSCRYGTFLYNSEQERRQSMPRAVDKTDSVWNLFLGENKAKWVNADFDASLDQSDLGVVLPEPKLVAFWPAMFRHSEEELNGIFSASDDIEDQPPAPEIIGPIETAADDPVISVVDNISHAKSSISRSGSLQSPSSPRAANGVASSPSESNLSRFSNTAAPQLQNAYASVMRFGGSTFKSLRKGYEDAVKDFSTAIAAPAEESVDKPAVRPAPAPAINPWAGDAKIERKEEPAPRSNPWADAPPLRAAANGSEQELADKLKSTHVSEHVDPLGVGL